MAVPGAARRGRPDQGPRRVLSEPGRRDRGAGGRRLSGPGAGRGRLTPKGEATKARIVRAAAELISTRGAAATCIEDIRRAAGVSGSQMSHYFDDRRALLRAVVAYRAAHLVPARLDTLAALEGWAERAIAAVRESPDAGGCVFGSLAGELAQTGEDVRDELAAGYARWERTLAEGLHAMRDRGELRADADPDRLAALLLAAHQGGTLIARTTRDPRMLEAALASALEQVRRYA